MLNEKNWSKIRMQKLFRNKFQIMNTSEKTSLWNIKKVIHKCKMLIMNCLPSSTTHQYFKKGIYLIRHTDAISSYIIILVICMVLNNIVH